MNITIQLQKISLTGKAVQWTEKDPGFEKYAGSVYFDNTNYHGFLLHTGMVMLLKNGRERGCYIINESA